MISNEKNIQLLDNIVSAFRISDEEEAKDFKSKISKGIATFGPAFSFNLFKSDESTCEQISQLAGFFAYSMVEKVKSKVNWSHYQIAIITLSNKFGGGSYGKHLAEATLRCQVCMAGNFRSFGGYGYDQWQSTVCRMSLLSFTISSAEVNMHRNIRKKLHHKLGERGLIDLIYEYVNMRIIIPEVLYRNILVYPNPR